MRRCTGGLALAVLALSAAGCSSGRWSPEAPVRLDAGPFAAAAVTPVHVSISGLPAAGLVTVQARTVDGKGRPWESAAVFRASAGGTLNLATSVPVSRSYHTADAGGLLWSLHPAFTTSPDTTFATSAAGFTVRLQVLIGGQVRAAATLQRPAAGHGKHPDGRRGRLRRDAVHAGCGQARRSCCRRARRIPCHGRHARRIPRRR